MLLWLFACSTLEKDSETPKDSADSGVDDSSVDAAVTIIQGIPNEAAGTALGLGDFDGDGRDDLAVSAYASGPTCVFSQPAAGLIPLVEGACYQPLDPYDFTGFSVGSAGDTNGDGREELAIGAIGAGDGSSGLVYLVDGAGGDLGQGLQLLGEADLDYAGSSVATAGDTNGDGNDDLLIGATGNTAGGAGAGKAYLLLGPITSGNLADVPTSFIGLGAQKVRHATPGGGDGVGYSLASAGDVNGDGLADVMVGAAGNDSTDTDAGKACIFLGPVAEGARQLSEADAVLTGGIASAFAGDRVADAGDTNSDGYDDVLVSADGENSQAGTVYLWRGPIRGGLSLNYAPVAWTGEKEGDQAGYAIAGGHDTNGDGVPDLVVGAWSQDSVGEDAGRIYLVESPFADGRFSLSESRFFNGSEANDYAGRAVDLGDVDGDGLAEILVGAPFASADGLAAGRAYLLKP